MGGPIEHLAQGKPGSASFRQLPRSPLWLRPQGVPQMSRVKPWMATRWERLREPGHASLPGPTARARPRRTKKAA